MLTFQQNSARTLRRTVEALTHSLTPLSETPALDAQVLLAHILKKPRAWVLAHPEVLLTHEQFDTIENARARLLSGVPLPYVLGHWEFFGLDFNITPDVLIPRPETELLVADALTWLRNRPYPSTAADIGTGSGCIAVALAHRLPKLCVIATDISRAALSVAASNARKHHLAGRIQFIQANLLPPTDAQHPFLDLICANLPYIPTTTLHQLKVYGREPDLALDGGSDGLELIRPLLEQAAPYLKPGGLLLLEIEASQGVAAHQIAQQHFPEAEIHILTDLAGHDRLLRIQTTT